MIAFLPGIEGRSFDVGLYWHSVEQDAIKSSIREIAKTEEFSRYCRVGHSVAFSSVGATGNKNSARCEPLILSVAKALGEGRCAVVLDEVDAQDDQGNLMKRWWLAVILDDLVIQDALFVSRPDARGRLEQLRRVHGSFDVDLSVGSETDSSDSPARALADVLAESGKLTWQRTGGSVGLISSLLLVGVCLAMGYFFFAPDIETTHQEQQYQQQINSARAEHERLTHKQRGLASVSQMLPLYRQWIHVDRYASRWQRESMACRDDCRSGWTGKSGARISVLKSRYPGVQLSRDSLFKAMTTEAFTQPDQAPPFQYAEISHVQDFCQALLHVGAQSCQVVYPEPLQFQGAQLLPPNELTRIGYLNIELTLPVYSEYQRLVQGLAWLKHDLFKVTDFAKPVIQIKNLFVMKGEG